MTIILTLVGLLYSVLDCVRMQYTYFLTKCRIISNMLCISLSLDLFARHFLNLDFSIHPEKWQQKKLVTRIEKSNGQCANTEEVRPGTIWMK